MLQRFIAFVSSSWLVLLLTLPAGATLRVVATTPDLAAVASAVGGSRVQVSALALPTQDPHFVAAKPSLALELNRADLLLLVGADLEAGWLPTLLVGARNGRIQPGGAGHLDCSTLVELLDVPRGKVDRSQGDVHAAGNPHYMLDPRIVERVAVGVGKRLASLDPAGRDAYLDGARRFLDGLRSARRAWEQRLAPLRGQKIVTFHRSFSYLADWLGLNVVDAVEPKPGSPPTPSHIAHLIERCKAQGVRLVLQESYHPKSTSQLVATRVGARFVQAPAGPDAARGETYVAFMERVVRKLEGP